MKTKYNVSISSVYVPTNARSIDARRQYHADTPAEAARKALYGGILLAYVDPRRPGDPCDYTDIQIRAKAINSDEPAAIFPVPFDAEGYPDWAKIDQIVKN